MIHPFRIFLYLVCALMLVGILFCFFVFYSPIEARGIDDPELSMIEENRDPEEKKLFIIPEVDLEEHHKVYDSTLTVTFLKRSAFLKKYNNASTDLQRIEILAEAGQYLQNALSESVFPAWYGTKWDFNGYSDKPRQGLIACGYFVSTPLKHVGFKLNRYKLAQQGASNIIKSLCPTEEVKVFSNNKFEALLTYIESEPDNLYVVGLDNHVGFIEKKNQKTEFIHSSYDTSVGGCVLRENARQSTVLPYSNIYVLGNISNNPELIRKWLFAEQVTIEKG